MASNVETLEFQAEARQLLRLVVHSIYSNKDVFLRELISNASDALDKLRLATLVDKDLPADVSDLHIAIGVDRATGVLTVRDNGVGMSRDELVQMIGTIGKSGTEDLVRTLEQARDAAAPHLIGQFGVGFYAAFMVADRVSLVTRRAGEEGGTRWESSGEGTYTIETIDTAPQGTVVSLHLKAVDTGSDYTSEWKIREIIKRYSDFITWPIRLEVERSNADDSEDGRDDDEEGGGPTIRDIETVNSMRALWARARDEVDAHEYHEFYRHLSHDWEDPLEVVTLKAEGTFEYDALLFIPSHAPYDLYQREGRRGLHLYVRRVLVTEDSTAFLPDYLRFVKGVVDLRDLSLNVSREAMQDDPRVRAVQRRLVKKVLSTIKQMMSADVERYRKFWTEFGATLKEGLLADFDNRTAILDVASFTSTRDSAQPTSLREYLDQMPDSQQDILYLVGDASATLDRSPHLEVLSDRGFEVLLLTDPVDPMWVTTVGEYQGHRFRSVTEGEVDLPGHAQETDDTPEREQREEFAGLTSWMAETLRDSVTQVRLSGRLRTSAACLVGDGDGVSHAMEHIYRARGVQPPRGRRTLELNPAHPLVAGLRAAHEQRPDDPSLADVVELIHGMAVLADGGSLNDPSRFTDLVAHRVTSTLTLAQPG